MRLEPALELNVAPIPAPICPNCGGEMSPTTHDPARFECIACGKSQPTDTLSPEAIERQQSHLHPRGIQRLLFAISSAKETA